MRKLTQAGFSITELIIAGGVVTFVFAGATIFMSATVAEKKKLERRSLELQYRDTMASLLRNHNFCTENLKTGIFDVNSAAFKDQGLPLDLYEVKDRVKTANVLFGANKKFGGLEIKRVNLRHLRKLNRNWHQGEIVLSFKDSPDEVISRLRVPVTMIYAEPYNGRIVRCFNAGAVDSKDQQNGKEICRLLMETMGDGMSTYQYDEMLDKCVQVYNVKCFGGSKTEAVCPADFPIYKSCTANLSSDSCPPGATCESTRPGKDGKKPKKGVAPQFRCSPNSTGDGATCSWALGANGSCAACCSNF